MGAGLRVAMVAGESSGDALGAALIAALRAERPEARFLGVAGPAMRAAGCEPLADAHELAVMGLAEVLPHLARLWRLRALLLERIAAWRPDVFIGVDAPGFNLSLARRLKRLGFATVQYVSPQVWAWRRRRVRGIARACDLVLCLLPFEPQFYAAHAVRARFVGHPLADQIAPGLEQPPARAAARAALGVAPDGALLALLPGSRVGEVERLGAPFLAAARRLAGRHAGLRLIAPMASARSRAAFEAALAAEQRAAGAPLAVQVLEGRSREALAAADAALVASGTATLEALLCRCPPVVAYRLGALTAGLVRALRLVRLPYVSLPNLLAGERLVPELIQREATPEKLAAALERTLADAARRAYVLQRFAAIHASLRCGGAARAAQSVLQLCAERREVA